MSKHQGLSEVLDIDYHEVLEKTSGFDIAVKKPTEITDIKNPPVDNKMAEDDFEEARKNLKNITMLGLDVLQRSADIAMGTDTPESIDAFSKLF